MSRCRPAAANTEGVPACVLWQVAAETEEEAVVAELPGGSLDGPVHAAKLDADTVRSTKQRIIGSTP